MKANELTIEVNAKITVDRSTAEGCLKMVEMYMNNTGAILKETKNGDGTITLNFTEAGRM